MVTAMLEVEGPPAWLWPEIRRDKRVKKTAEVCETCMCEVA